LGFINQYAAAWSALRSEHAANGRNTPKRLRITLKRSHHNFRLDEMPDNIRKKFEGEPGVRLRLSVSSKESADEGPRSSADWQLLTPDDATSERGTVLSIDAEGQTVRVPEKSTMPDTYVILASASSIDETALRLEVLPEIGVKFYSVDHFVLGEVRIEVESTTRSGEFYSLPLRSAVAAEQHITDSLPQQNVSAIPLIDGDAETNWPIAPVERQSQSVVFEVDDAMSAAWRSYCQSLFMLNEFVYVN
jgi:hypothetical protein